MALEFLDGFEEGPDGIVVPGDPAGVSLTRRSGYVLPGGQTYSFTAARPGGGPSLATFSAPGLDSSWLGFLISGAFTQMALYPAEGIGFCFARGDTWASAGEIEGGLPADTTGFNAGASITWGVGERSGGVDIVVGYDELAISSYWDDGDSSGATDSTVSLTGPPDPGDGSAAYQAWVEFSVSLDGGWVVKYVDGATLASGAFPKGPGALSRRGINFSATAHSNPSTASTDARRNPRLLVDDIFGWPGQFDIAAAVRLFPREDGRGMSSAPRIHPAPRSGRIIGGHQ